MTLSIERRPPARAEHCARRLTHTLGGVPLQAHLRRDGCASEVANGLEAPQSCGYLWASSRAFAHPLPARDTSFRTAKLLHGRLRPRASCSTGDH